MGSLNRLTALEAARRLAQRAITAEALLRDCLARIAEREAEVRAWAHIDPEQALAQARSLDAGSIRGPLHGLPVGVKDIFDTHDMPTEYGSAIYRGHRPVADAACVALSRRAGAVILGKTVTTEFATFPPGKTRNPLDLDHTPGGSSSGSAAGVADFMMPLAFGTQTAGSVIRPAAYCGITGYKPTFNTLARGGVKLGADSLDTVGVFGRNIGDVAYLVAALARRPELQLQAWSGTAPRIGMCRSDQWDRVQPETVAAMENAARLLAAKGAGVAEVALPGSFAGLLAAQTTIMAFEGACNRADDLDRFGDKMDPALAESIRSGARISGEEYARARAHARDCRARLEEVFGGCDVLLAPAAPGEAPRGLASTGSPVMNQVWTLLHVPCVSVNAGAGPSGLPVGLQAIGRIDDDPRMLSAADWIAQRLAN